MLVKTWLKAHGAVWVGWAWVTMYAALAWIPEQTLSNPLGSSRQTVSGTVVVVSIGACITVRTLDDQVRPRVLHPSLQRRKRLAWGIAVFSAFTLSTSPFWSSSGLSEVCLALFMLLAVPLLLICAVGLPAAWMWQLLYFLAHLLISVLSPPPWWALTRQQNSISLNVVLLLGTLFSIAIYAVRGPREWSIMTGRARLH